MDIVRVIFKQFSVRLNRWEYEAFHFNAEMGFEKWMAHIPQWEFVCIEQ
mgnify:CR=1 FL=1